MIPTFTSLMSVMLKAKSLLPALSLSLFALPALVGSATAASQAQGFVYEDKNLNGLKDTGEPGIPNVLVSNQREIVKTDANGRWELPASDDCIFFVIKPRNWMTPVNRHRLPQFHYIHKPEGSPETEYEGVAPTGPLPGSIDFPLYPHPEPDTFKAIYFGDTQARDQKEVDYITHDVVEELLGTDASFGVTLGDIVFDDLALFNSHNASVALIGIPWYNVIGNHDINFDTPNDRLSDETYERHFGPSYYAYEWGPVWFVSLDNIVWGGAKPEGSGGYTGGLGEQQLEFLSSLMEHIPENRLVMFQMHIPLYNTHDREALFRLIEHRPYTMSISGHTHWHEHRFMGEEDGWQGDQPHHHIVNVTVCGSWWTGEPDELGIPHTTMRDGAPNGYSFITFDGQEAVLDFKASRRPADYQMNIHAPEVVSRNETGEKFVHVNVFNGSERSTVSMRIGRFGEWIDLEKVIEKDPYYLESKQSESSRPDHLLGRPLSNPVDSFHLWKAPLPDNLETGQHLISVKTTDMWGRVFNASRSIRVTE